jgi:RTX calcium-binding nonapeptide repeat (4 copies)
MRFIAFLLLICTALTPRPAHAQILVDSAKGLRLAVEQSEAGEEIIIAAGNYDIADLKLPRDMTLRGESNVVFHSTKPVAKGILNPLPGASIRIENIKFFGASSPDQNGAGIRHDGENLTIVDSTFERNENGVLATGSERGNITVQNSKFLRNGYGDGYSHGIYVVRAASMQINDSQFTGTRIGHHVKSLARVTEIRGSKFDDADGRTSYAIDASKGGEIKITGNQFIQAANADNPAIINYDLSRGGKPGNVTIADNRIINRHRRGKLLRNATAITPIIFGNEITNEGAGELNYTQSATPPPDQNHIAAGSNAPSISMLSLERASTKAPQQSGVLHAPEFDRSKPALAFFKLENNWKKNSPSDYLTFGQAFAPGTLAPGDIIAARYGELILPAQIDVKALHDDGSVRHGVVTVATPEIKSGKTQSGALIKSADTSNMNGLSSENTPALPADRLEAPISLTFYFADGSTQNFKMNMRALAARGSNDKSADLWLNGPLVREFRIDIAAAPHLKLRFDIRTYRDDDIRVSIGFINQKSFAPGRRDSVYDVRIGAAFSAEKVPHHRSANWRRVFWIGDQPRLHIVHDLETLITSNAVAPLDVSIGVDAALIARRDAALRDLPPLSPALIERFMPMTGGRPDIGIYPQWTSHYLATQTEASKRVMLANADAAGAVPWHYADDRTGAPISIEKYPKFWADERGLEARYAPGQPNADIFASSDGGWTPDHSHKPALTAVPYLVTGDHYYADELAMQSAWAVFGRWPALREGGVKVIDVEQVRASAWSLRDLSDAAFLLPDSHPSKAYLSRTLHENLRLMSEKYIDRRAMQDAGELEGFFEELIEREPERISPWQNDYMALSLWLAARRGDDNANTLLSWSANFQSRRFIDANFNFRFGSSYQLPVKNAQTQRPVSTWTALAAKIRKSTPPTQLMEGYPELANGYIGSAMAALTAIASETGSPGAFEALALLMRETKDYPLWTLSAGGGVYRNNNFLFMLKAPNGVRYSHKDITWKKTEKNKNTIIVGKENSERLTGGDGDDIVLGLNGDDVISGGPGSDYLGGGRGDDILTGGDGADIFAFADDEGGADIITDFDPDQDRVHIARSIVKSLPSIAAALKDTPDGARFAYPGGHGSIVFKGISASDLTSENLALLQKTPAMIVLD